MRTSLILSQILFLFLFPIWLELTNYLHPIVIAVVWLCYSFLAVYIVCLGKGVVISFRKNLLHVLIGLYSFSLLILLFMRPNNQEYNYANFTPFETISFYFSGKVEFLVAFYNLGANIALFIPFGLYYRYVSIRSGVVKLVILAALGISMIEGGQFLTHRGSLDIDDFILNIAGVMIGYFMFPLVQKVFTAKK
ncbi:VanZ family protein [Rossellomorea vietnamensis]|uniref:VanZ family protein n=1 Tax=Rossellomorea vietnamensis TaxID=218284 RepID=A0A5D4MJI8_9BACI|nr:VanZ family protein [Rossellomorea vietnamensis]TYS01454.1 VanZ family protein [Rossellomorea vietnamensis]